VRRGVTAVVQHVNDTIEFEKRGNPATDPSSRPGTNAAICQFPQLERPDGPLPRGCRIRFVTFKPEDEECAKCRRYVDQLVWIEAIDGVIGDCRKAGRDSGSSCKCVVQ